MLRMNKAKLEKLHNYLKIEMFHSVNKNSLITQSTFVSLGAISTQGSIQGLFFTQYNVATSYLLLYILNSNSSLAR